MHLGEDIHEFTQAWVSIAHSFAQLVDCLCPKIVGVGFVVSSQKGKTTMAKFTAVKATAGAKKATPFKHGAVKAPGDFQLSVDDTGKITALGVDDHGNQVDISTVATMTTAAVDNPALATIDTPTGVSVLLHPVGSTGSIIFSATITWNDGSIGPFSGSVPLDLVPGPAGGVILVPSKGP